MRGWGRRRMNFATAVSADTLGAYRTGTFGGIEARIG